MRTRIRKRRDNASRRARSIQDASARKRLLLLVGTVAALVLLYGVKLDLISSNPIQLVHWTAWLGNAMTLGLVVAGATAYLWLRRPDLLTRDLEKWFFVFLVLINAVVAQMLGFLGPYSPYLIPVSLSVGLVVMFFGSEVGLVTNLVLAVLVGMSVPNPAIALVLFAGGMVMVLRARRLERQRELILIGLEVGLVNIAALLALAFLSGLNNWTWSWEAFAVAGVNGPSSALLLMGLVPLAEYVLQRTSPVGLIELLNPSHPLLERLAKAPGTQIHSQNVSQLALAAARAVGADPLLTRVGGMYHDIGKAADGVRITYFAENQHDGYNPHDHLPPNISRIILQNHVKAGLEMGKAHGLKQDVLQFIGQHHGTSVMRFFYLKALQDPDNNASLSLENYRYDGPKPQTRETAILMISDATESASRSVEDFEQMDAIIDRIVRENLEDGQFDECGMTMSDFTKARASFKDTLRSMMHTRPKNFPEAKALKQASNGKTNSDSAREGGEPQSGEPRPPDDPSETVTPFSKN